jgi:hypothetical protein
LREVNEWLDSNLLAEIDELEDQQKALEVGPSWLALPSTTL